MNAPTRVPAEEVKAAISGVELNWRDLHVHQSSLARLLPRRAWVGLMTLRSCFSTSGEFRVYKVPARDEWRRRRIAWQHNRLTWGEVTADDATAERDVAVQPAQSPNKIWLEQNLRDEVWDLAELLRKLWDLADAAQALTRPHRIEQLVRASEG